MEGGLPPLVLPFAAFFGIVLFGASSGVVVLAAQSEQPWLWWCALLPLAVSHWVAGFLVTWNGSKKDRVFSALTSVVTAALATIVAAWLAYGIGLDMPRHDAVLVLVAASAAGLLGSALYARLRLSTLRSR
jgi:hypothetical protein